MNPSSALAIVAGLAACAGRPSVEPPGPPAGWVGRLVVFEGTCDASGAVPLNDHLFVVADDEDNVLRVYDADRGGPASSPTDVSPALGLPIKGKKRPRAAEMDLEAGTRLGDRAYWLASHGRSTRGEARAERLMFFATTLPQPGEPLQVAGRPYHALLPDLLAEESLAPFELAAAAEKGPKEPGGLNLEGMTATPDGNILLAFRNPVPDGRALIVPLLNPAELIRDEPAQARFAPPTQVDLGGLGVRSLSFWRGRYLIIAGSVDGTVASRLYIWTGGAEPPTPIDVDLSWLNPEGFFSPDGLDEILLLSDDGDVVMDGRPCKKLRDPARKRFRGVWVRPGG